MGKKVNREIDKRPREEYLKSHFIQGLSPAYGAEMSLCGSELTLDSLVGRRLSNYEILPLQAVYELVLQ